MSDDPAVEEPTLTEMAALVHHDAAVAEHLMVLALDGPTGDEDLVKADAVVGELIARAARLRRQICRERVAAARIPSHPGFG